MAHLYDISQELKDKILEFLIKSHSHRWAVNLMCTSRTSYTTFGPALYTHTRHVFLGFNDLRLYLKRRSGMTCTWLREVVITRQCEHKQQQDQQSHSDQQGKDEVHHNRNDGHTIMKLLTSHSKLETVIFKLLPLKDTVQLQVDKASTSNTVWNTLDSGACNCLTDLNIQMSQRRHKFTYRRWHVEKVLPDGKFTNNGGWERGRLESHKLKLVLECDDEIPFICDADA